MEKSVATEDSTELKTEFRLDVILRQVHMIMQAFDWLNLGFLMFFSYAPYASHPQDSRGRFFKEESCFMRDPLQRDRDRIIHSTAFRRLKHKTQVFFATEGDYYRTRLTHSMEVAQIARGLARSLQLNEDLAEALSLAHDLGHAPFGHAGEDALEEAIVSAGGWNHNDQTFRILTRLEKRYPLFDGLNLSWETLEGIVKHNGPILGGRDANPSLRTIYDFSDRYDLELETYPSAEAQISALADDIAYNSHDIDDGLNAKLFTIAQVREVPLVGRIMGDVEKLYPELAPNTLIAETIRRIINLFVADLFKETQSRLKSGSFQTVADVRHSKSPVAALSEEMAKNLTEIHGFLCTNMYFHPLVSEMKQMGRAIVRDLFSREEHRRYSQDNPVGKDVIADAIAVLTDQEALVAHEKLTGRHYISPLTRI